MSNDNSTKSNIRKVITIAVFVLLLIGAVYFYFAAPDNAESPSVSDSVSSSTSYVESNDNTETGSTSGQSSQAPQSEQSEPQSEQSEPQSEQSTQSEPQTTTLKFRSKSLLEQHYQKHGVEMGFSSAEEYEKAAAAVPANPAALHKTEKEDGDDVYYIEATNEFVVVSTDGYLRTYFLPSAGKSYFDRQ
ncbi:MAG: hypothetical protein ACI4QY_01050 [Oscillospiraceae bacterium]